MDLFIIDSSNQCINTKRIESIRIAFGGDKYKVKMFSGELFFISKESLEELFECDR